MKRARNINIVIYEIFESEYTPYSSDNIKKSKGKYLSKDNAIKEARKLFTNVINDYEFETLEKYNEIKAKLQTYFTEDRMEYKLSDFVEGDNYGVQRIFIKKGIVNE